MSAESFIKTLKICKSNYFLQKTNFPRKVLCSSRMHFWQLLQSFCASGAEWSFHSRKTSKKLKRFLEKTVQSKISFGHIKCRFNEPAGSSYRTPKTFSLNFRRKIWIFSAEKYKLTQSFSITQPFCQKSQNFRSLLEKIVKFFKN